MDLPKVLNMLHTLIGMWDLLAQHLTWLESLFHTLYTRVLIWMLIFGFSERPFMQMKKKTMQISLICFLKTLHDTILEWGKNFLQFNLNCTFVKLENDFYKQYKLFKHMNKSMLP
jgi:hypothetical protein